MKKDQVFHVRMTKNERELLTRHAQYCGMSEAEYIRSFISGFIPKVAPPYSYHLMMKELNTIGGNLNQLAKVAHAERYIDADKYKIIASLLFKRVDEIDSAVSKPISIEEYENGDH